MRTGICRSDNGEKFVRHLAQIETASRLGSRMDIGGGGRDRTGVDGFAGRTRIQSNQRHAMKMAKSRANFAPCEAALYRSSNEDGEQKTHLLFISLSMEDVPHGTGKSMDDVQSFVKEALCQ